MGVYFKVKRGNTRIDGKKRFAIYSSAENGNTLIDEVFDYRSIFYKSQQNDKQFQPKKMGIKLKQETVRQGQKDKVLGKSTFDIARFVGKENVIYELSLEGGVTDSAHEPRITLEISVTKGAPIATATNGGAGAIQMGDAQYGD